MDGVEPNVRHLFAADATERLDRMGDDLLQLERAPGDSELLGDLFRQAHSLKGAAGVIGLHHVADLCHALEGPLQRLRSGQLELTAAVTDSLLAVIDGLRSMVVTPLDGADEGQHAGLAAGLTQRLAEGAGREVRPVSSAADHMPNAPASTEGHPATRAEAHTPIMQVAVHRLDQIDRLISESAAAHLRVGQLIAETMGTDPNSVVQYRDLARLLSRLQEVTMQARMVPLSTVTPNLHRVVRDVAHTQGKQVRWEVEGGDTEIDRNVLEKLRDPLIHLVRNSVDHGIEPSDERVAAGKPAEGFVRLRALQRGSDIVISISDDGRGIDLELVQAAAARDGIDVGSLAPDQIIDLIFRPGLSTASEVTEVSGRGVGLDVVRTNLGLVRGRVEVRSVPHHGSEFTVSVPLTLTIVQCLIVESGGKRLAVPLHAVFNLLPADAEEYQVAGQAMVMNGEVAVPLASLALTLGIGEADRGPVVVVAGDPAGHAFRVGALVGQRDLVVKGLGRLLPRLDSIAGAGIEADGSIVVVLDVPGLVSGVRHGIVSEPPAARAEPHRPSILVVDDALTVRELERSILERSGYAVRVAADGMEALKLLQREPADLVLTDLEMPAMDGIRLIEAIRRHKALSSTPVVILTSHDSEADRQRGLAAGADAYVIKRNFDQPRLLSLVEQLLLGGKT